MINFHDRKRVTLVAFSLFALFSLLLIQFFKVQVIEKKKWEKLAKLQHQKVVKEPFHRGLFFASAIRDGHIEEKPLVVDIEKFHLYIDPDAIPKDNRDEICERLVAITKMENGGNFRTQFDKKSRSRKLAMWLDASVRGNVLAWWNPYARKNRIPRNAIYFIADYKRSYPYGKLLGQVLQTVREDRDPKTGQAIPTGGLDLPFDKVPK
ncbi:MAG: penicillin-binding protein 2, partial [Simkaniaceae bacterium]|nr:penicillin-binding protein 2 [Simkaniaceae bacterium]